MFVAAEAVTCPLQHPTDVVDPRRDGRQFLELGTRRLGDDPSERRLSDAGWTVEDHRWRAVSLDRESQRRAFPQDVPLAD